MVASRKRKREGLDETGNGVAAAELLTVAQVSNRLNVHPNTVRRWAQQGLLNPYRIGPRRDRRFRPDDVDRFLRAKPV